ncbi:hypothetical protein [Lysobacter xanthus]
MDELPPQDDPAERLRREYEGRLSMLRAPGASARLNGAFRRPVRLRGLHAGAQHDVHVDAGAVLAKAARHTARWLGLNPRLLAVVTGLPGQADVTPELDSEAWARCLALVRLGGRLESKLGRRGTVRAWLTGRHLQLKPTPLDVLAQPEGLAALHDYLDAFER